MVTLHEVITFLVSMQISISSLQTHNVNRCGRSRHLARKLSLRRKRSSPNVFEMAATETITSIILIDRKSGSAGMPRPISYAVFCLKKKPLLSGECSGQSFRLGRSAAGLRAASDVLARQAVVGLRPFPAAVERFRTLHQDADSDAVLR